MTYDSWKTTQPDDQPCPECGRHVCVCAPRAWEGPMWNDCGGCNFTRRSSDTGRRYCAPCTAAALQRLARLAANLAIAGGLCHSYELGAEHGHHFPDMCTGFRPGCAIGRKEATP